MGQEYDPYLVFDVRVSVVGAVKENASKAGTSRTYSAGETFVSQVE
jgi:hypothetical protein|tara:strand:+ start:785 stop:922 length:138 start_codon:yes stop_codon:yes gene_type:complete